MLKRGKPASYVPNLFNTWLEYQERLGKTQADIIRLFNSSLGKNYDNVTFYRWKTNEKSLPDNIMIEFILPSLPELYRWFFKEQGFTTKNIDFDVLSVAFSPVIKNPRGKPAGDESIDE